MAIGLLALLAALGVAAAAPETVPSPRPGTWVTLDRGSAGLTATLHDDGHRIPIVTDFPLSGDAELSWPDAATARLDLPCGTGCSATFLASARGVTGPFPAVVSVDATWRRVVYLTRGEVVVATIDPPSHVLGRMPEPSWCRDWACDPAEAHTADGYVISHAGKRAAVTLTTPR